MGECGPRWGGSLRLGLSQLGCTLHPSNLSFPGIDIIRHRRPGIIKIWTALGTAPLLVVGSVRGGPSPSQATTRISGGRVEWVRRSSRSFKLRSCRSHGVVFIFWRDGVQAGVGRLFQVFNVSISVGRGNASRGGEPRRRWWV